MKNTLIKFIVYFCSIILLTCNNSNKHNKKANIVCKSIKENYFSYNKDSCLPRNYLKIKLKPVLKTDLNLCMNNDPFVVSNTLNLSKIFKEDFKQFYSFRDEEKYKDKQHWSFIDKEKYKNITQYYDCNYFDFFNNIPVVKDSINFCNFSRIYCSNNKIQYIETYSKDSAFYNMKIFPIIFKNYTFLYFSYFQEYGINFNNRNGKDIDVKEAFVFIDRINKLALGFAKEAYTSGYHPVHPYDWIRIYLLNDLLYPEVLILFNFQKEKNNFIYSSLESCYKIVYKKNSFLASNFLGFDFPHKPFLLTDSTKYYDLINFINSIKDNYKGKKIKYNNKKVFVTFPDISYPPPPEWVE